MISVHELSDTEVIARTLWGEARNQGAAGMQAVACVIRNRRDNPGWWGKTLRGVCLAHQQFSCWNDSDPEHAAMHADALAGPAIELARKIAGDIEHLPDITHGADHYETVAASARTKWDDGHTPTYRYGTHVFFKLGLYG